ncbi:MAG: hypothetical protein JXR96_03445 [Deltaproteobacteria bacterium]|nr:hypothetical protein [Deltaproteobacteria bacterium]
MDRAMSWSGRTVCLLGFLAFASACGEKVDGQIAIELILPCSPSQSDLTGDVELYCIAVEDRYGQEIDSSCSHEIATVELRAAETSTPVFVVVRGLAGDMPVFQGRSAPVSLVSGEEATVAVPVCTVGHFSVVAGDMGGCQPLPVPLWGHTATVFPSGHVLTVGTAYEGADPARAALLLDPYTQRATGLSTPDAVMRSGHAAALLEDGRLLAIGGLTRLGSPADKMAMLRGAEPMIHAYDIAQDYAGQLSFEFIAMAEARPRPSAEVFFGQDVLVASGQRLGPELFRGGEEASGMVEVTGDPFGTAGTPSVFALDEDSGLVIGGAADRLGSLVVDEDDRQANYADLGASLPSWDRPSGFALEDGRVAVIGSGQDASRISIVVIDTDGLVEEIETPSDFPRAGHASTRLPDGRIFVTGGSGGGGSGYETWLVDPVRGRCDPGPEMHAARGLHTAGLLPDGRVVVIGGRDPGAMPGDGPGEASYSVEMIAF